MRDILAEIVADKKDIVAKAKRSLPFGELRQRVRSAGFRMSHRLRGEDWSLIAECKLQSPAKGLLCRRHSVAELAQIYAANGASVLSVHTDPHFSGKNEDLIAVRQLVDLPIMRKDFIIDEYQIYEARLLGADAILLIARILSAEQLTEYLYTAWGLGMDVLVEVHDAADLTAALATPAEFIGINNRNLTTFDTSVDNTLALLGGVDGNRTIISESGIHTAADAIRLREAGCQGILVGEGLVTAPDIGAKTRELTLAGLAAAASA